MDWNEVSVKVQSKDLETASAVATAVSSGGLYIEDYSDMLEMLPLVGRYDDVAEQLLASDTAFSVVHTYHASAESANEAAAFIAERLAALSISFELITGTIEETDWSESWKRYYHPQKIGERLVICPSWESYNPADGEIVVTLDPGMSFGTGDHESTRLCLEFLEETRLLSKRLLDVGTGSGILGIAALKLGAASVTAIDIDPAAVDTAKKNAVINGVGGMFNSLCGDITESDISKLAGGDFDIVVANVVADFHIEASGLYVEKLKPGGLLIVSGIVQTRSAKVRETLETAGFKNFGTKTQNGWEAILAERA